MADITEIELVLTFLTGLLTWVQINVHLLFCYTKDERHQVVSSCVLLTLKYASVIFRSNFIVGPRIDDKVIS